MKTNVESVKNDWLLKFFREINEDSHEFQYINCWDKTKEEVLSIADSYSSYYTAVYIYKFETILQ